MNTADLTCVHLAASFIFSTTILVLYTSYLTSSAVLIGLVPAVQQMGFMLPQLLMARRAEALCRKKPFVVKVSTLERVPYLFIALFVLIWREPPAWLAYAVLITSIAVASGSGGMASPAWKAMLGKVIHPKRRGLLFSSGYGVGGLLGVGGAALAGHILQSRPYPVSFGLCFLLAFLAQALSWSFLTLNREPPRKPERTAPTFAAYVRALPEVLRSNRNFSYYILAMVLILLGGMGISFHVLYAREVFSIGDGFAASLTVVALISQSIGTPLLGIFADSCGHKRLAELSTILGGGAVVLVLVLRSAGWLYPVFALVNLCTAGLMVSRFSITMEFGHADKVPTYTAVSGTILAVPTLLAPIIGGWLLDATDFRTLFAVALVLYLAGLAVMLLAVADPRVKRLRKQTAGPRE